MTPTVRQYLASLPERRQLVLDVLNPVQRSVRDRTLVSTYNRLQPGSDGRIHTGISVATTSGRLASSGSIVEESSSNLQNMANKIATLDPLYQVRDTMCSDPGFLLLCRDFSGAEMLLAFAYAGDREWVDRLIVGESVHGVHAKEAFGLSCKPGQVKKKHPEVYTTAKNLGFLSIYSGSARTAMVTFNKDYPIHGQRITEKEVRRFQQVLYDLHPLHEWWGAVESQLRRDKGTIINCFQDRRPLRDPDEHNRLKDALSYLPQSTVAHRMNESLVRVHDELDRAEEIELYHQNHDELILQVIPECLDEALDFTKEVMEERFMIHGQELYIPTEAKVGVPGGSWGATEKVS